MYYMYIRVVILGALSRHSSVWTRSHSYGLCQILHICSHLYKSFACKTLNRIAPSFRTAPVFLPPLYKSFEYKTLNATSPFLRCLDCGVCVAIRLVRFGYNPSTGRIALRVAPISTFPLAREPTVTAWRGTTLGRDITNAISLIVSLRFVRRLRNNMAQSLVLYVKSDARYGRRLAAPTGKTGGTRIEKYRSLIMPLVRKCKEQHALAHLYNRLARRLFARRRCGSCSVFLVAQSVNKYTPNGFSFRAQPKTLSS